MPGVNAVIELENVPTPLPSVVLLLVVVGLEVVVLQQTPFTVIDAPPSLVILPPLIAEFIVIEEIEFVLNVGIVTVEVLKLCTLP